MYNDLAIVATLCGLAAGTAELVVGRSSWTGNKDDPTTLGWVTIGLALAIAAAAVTAARRRSAAAHLAAGIAMMVAAAIGNTTAGRAWAPAAVAAVAAGGAELITAQRQRSLRVLVAAAWPSTLLVVLGAVYLTFRHRRRRSPRHRRPRRCRCHLPRARPPGADGSRHLVATS